MREWFLAPVQRRADERLNQLQDLAFFRKASELHLAEQQLVIHRHLEAPLAPAAQGHLDQDRRPGSGDFGRQTDGLIEVVSGNAVLDRDPVFRIQHAPSLAER